MDLVCPICRHPIDEAACDESSDRASCPACREDWSYKVTRAFSEVAAVARGPVPKHFTVSREGDGESERVTLTYAPKFSGAYALLLMAAVFLGLGAFFVWVLFRDGNTAAGWMCLPFLLVLELILFWAGFYNRGVREFTFARGKGTYRKSVFWKGRLREFPINDSLCFAWTAAPLITGKSLPVLDHIEVDGRKVLTVHQVFRPEEHDYFNAVFLDWLPRNPEDFKPIEPKEETPEEAAARRVYEAAEAAEARRQRSFLRRYGWILVVVAYAAFRWYNGIYTKEAPRYASEHMTQVLRTFQDRGDYRSVAAKPPLRAGLEYRFKFLPSLTNELDTLTELLNRFIKAKDSNDAAALALVRLNAGQAKARVATLFTVDGGKPSKLTQFFLERYQHLVDACGR